MVDVVVGFIDKGPTTGPERVAGKRDVVQLDSPPRPVGNAD